ncbi:MAG: hypothetical protein ACI38U_12025 [Corynebacterium sp.]|uniref:hypothetical protein n=1 Tax=Corynebacterium sp. TaxID=1720 RepID=UPI003F00F343
MAETRTAVWTRRCAIGAFAVALPTALWRVLPGLGVTLGTPADWREFQQLPGSGTWYVLGLSGVQLLAAACCLLLAVPVERVVPPRASARLGRAIPTAIGVAGLTGAGVLLVLVVMSIIAWEKVDPFAGETYGGWAWLSLACYLTAALWPVLLAPASIGYLLQNRGHRRALRR